MSFLPFLDPFVYKFRKILVLAANTFIDLDDNPASFQFHLFPIVKVPVAAPMHIPNEVSPVIVDHDAFVERVVFDSAILPSLLFSLEIVGEEADKFEDQG